MEELSENQYRKTMLCVLHVSWLKRAKQLHVKHQDMLCGDTRNEYQQAAYRFHKDIIDPFYTQNSQMFHRFNSNSDLCMSIETHDISNSMGKIEDQDTGFEFYQCTNEPFFHVFHKRAIYSDYYDEDENCGETEYQSDSSIGALCSDMEEEAEEEEEEDQEE